MRRRAAGLGVSSVTVLTLLVGGWVWADAADLAPGPLTSRAPAPAPAPPPPEPSLTPPAVPGLAVEQRAAVDPAAPAPVDARALAEVVAPLLADPALGPSPALSVRDLATGAEIAQSRSAEPVEPASATKLVTAAAALRVLGADHRLLTEVGWQTGDSRAGGRPAMVLVGGGDLLLAAGEGDPDATVGRVGLLDLARSAVAAATAGRDPLLVPGVVDAVDVVVDDSLLGEGPAPGRAPADTFFASPPSSLAVDGGDLGGGRGRDAVPATTAGAAFATALGTALEEALGDGAPGVGGVAVSTEPVTRTAVVAQARSAPVADVLAHLLLTSDNTVADSVAALVAAELGAPTAFPAAAATVVGVVEQDLGVDLGPTVLVDGSGLTDGSSSTAGALTALLGAAAAAPVGDDLALLPQLLPVAGLEGTLSERFTDDDRSDAGRGVVRAKTGTLTGTTALAGVTTTASGRGVAFALLSDQVPAGGTAAGRAAADRVAAAVTACC